MSMMHQYDAAGASSLPTCAPPAGVIGAIALGTSCARAEGILDLDRQTLRACATIEVMLGASVIIIQ